MLIQKLKFFKSIPFDILCSRRFFFRKKTLWLLVLFLCLSVLLLLCVIFASFSKCSFLEVEKAVFVICDKYQNREALGNLCADLCELNHLNPNNCLPNHLGKDVVFEATYFSDHVVMKSSKLNLEDFDQIFYLDQDGNQVHPDVDVFLSMIVKQVQSNLDVTLKQSENNSLELLTKIWTRNMKNFNGLPLSIQISAMNNIWFLTQQTEYLLLKYHEDTNVFPKIMGTCGPFYAVEFIEPLDNYFSMLYPSWKEGFNKRADLALKVLKFLEETDKFFPKLHFCDLKVGHFGLDKNKNVKLLDMDMVFSEKQLIQNMVSVQNCTSDNDCSFIDCKGTCDTASHQCIGKIVDSNFQRVCISLLAGRLVQSYFGLLSSPPPAISKDLNALLQKCWKPMNEEAARSTSKQLKNILLSIS